MGKYELKKSVDGQYYFVLKAANGEVIALSERYTSKSGALEGIESVREHAHSAELVDLTE